jgi:hypothetical protein
VSIGRGFAEVNAGSYGRNPGLMQKIARKICILDLSPLDDSRRIGLVGFSYMLIYSHGSGMSLKCKDITERIIGSAWIARIKMSESQILTSLTF